MLKEVFAGTNVIYSVLDKKIILSVKAQLPQQDKKVIVSGTVLDVQGDPIIGASVSEKDVLENGTITDMNGFSNSPFLHLKHDCKFLILVIRRK